jgi:hypothetical protein
VSEYETIVVNVVGEGEGEEHEVRRIKKLDNDQMELGLYSKRSKEK